MDEPEAIDRGGQRRARLVGAAVGMLGALTVGGAGLAWAQETPTTDPPTTEAPGEEAPATPEAGPGGRHADGDCPEKDGTSGGGSSSGQSTVDDTSV